MTPSAAALLTPAPVLDAVRDPFSKRTEQLRELRQGLQLRADPDLSSVIALVSPGAGEGRSRLAAELAWLFAQLGEATLLVDCNLRKPAQHQLFSGAGGGKGLADALNDGSEPLLYPVHSAPQLSVVTGGTPPKHPVELLSSTGFSALLSQWRSRYRHILLDTPAFNASSDAIAVASEAGAALMQVREHYTSFDGLKAMAERLTAARIQLLGTVSQGF